LGSDARDSSRIFDGTTQLSRVQRITIVREDSIQKRELVPVADIWDQHQQCPSWNEFLRRISRSGFTDLAFDGEKEYLLMRGSGEKLAVGSEGQFVAALEFFTSRGSKSIECTIQSKDTLAI